MKALSWVVVAGTLAGLAAGLWAVGRTGLAAVLGIVSRLGAGGSLLILASSLVVLAALGAAWSAGQPPGAARRLSLFIWGRATREAANDLLPFSHIGGLVIGLRTVLAGGVPAGHVYVATLIDCLTELAAQLLLTLYALTIFGTLLAGPGAPASLEAIAWGGVAAGVTTVVLLAALQRPALRLATPLARRLLPDGERLLATLGDELSAFVARPGAILAPLLWNLAAWLLSVGAAWLILHLLDAPLPFLHVLGLEALIFALRSSAFVVPGALGVQEAGYALLGPLFGLDAETAVALSLVKRARDLALGLPTLLLWQLLEVRRARTA